MSSRGMETLKLPKVRKRTGASFYNNLNSPGKYGGNPLGRMYRTAPKSKVKRLNPFAKSKNITRRKGGKVFYNRSLIKRVWTWFKCIFTGGK